MVRRPLGCLRGGDGQRAVGRAALGGRLVAGAGLARGRSPIRRRPRGPGRTRAIGLTEVENLLARTHLPIRERTLWRMLYETAARAEEILALDVDELDLRNRRARVRRKGGAADVIVWRTATARLLPRLLGGRRSGPVFLTDRRARVELPPVDVAPGSGRARLSYRRAAETFEQATKELTGGPLQIAPAAALRAGPRRRGRDQHLHPTGVFRTHLSGLPDPLPEGLAGGAGPMAAEARSRYAAVVLPHRR